MTLHSKEPEQEASPSHVGVPLVDECERCGQSGPWARQCISHRGETESYHGYSPGSLCRSCHMELLPDPEVLYTELLDSDFTFYFGAASGSARKALRKAEESHVMVSFATQNNGRIGPEDVHFVDSGGAPDMFKQGRFADTGDYVSSDEDYIDYVLNNDAELWSLRDYPCEDSVLEMHGRTVAEHQRMTTERHRDLLNIADDKGVEGQPVSVVQGQTVDDYLTHLDTLRDAGCLTDYVGIGSVCRRNAEQEIASIIRKVRDALSPGRSLHAYGIKKTVLEKTDATSNLTSSDSCAYDFGLRMESQYGNKRYWWKTVLSEYLDYKEDIGEIIRDTTDEEQATMSAFAKSPDTSKVHM